MNRGEYTSDEHRAIHTSFSEFARREVHPGAAERDRTGEYPAALVQRLGELDGMGISVPEEDGGLGLDTAAQIIAIEDIAYADAALASIYTAHYLGLESLRLAATDHQRTHWVAPLAHGSKLAGFALTEPHAGSDIASMSTTARGTNDGWVLSGQKTFISNAAEAHVLVIFAKTDPDGGLEGISAFIVPTETAGITFSPPQDKLGLRSAPTHTIYLDGIHLPPDALLGEEGAGGRLALTTLNAARIDIAAMANGIARRAFDLAHQYAGDRRQFGRPIEHFQAIQLLLGQMDADLQASRLTTLWAASQRDHEADLRRPGAIAKYTATEACFRIVDSALQIHGGAGYLAESEIERLYRDCRVLRIYEGTSQIQLLTIASSLRTS